MARSAGDLPSRVCSEYGYGSAHFGRAVEEAPVVQNPPPNVQRIVPALAYDDAPAAIEFLCRAEDPEGQRWMFQQHVRDVSTEEMAAALAAMSSEGS